MRSMTNLAFALLPAAALVATAATAQTVREGGRKLTATLTGAAEVNSEGVFNQGDPDGTGTAVIIVNPGQRRICYELTVDNIATPTASHIHIAPINRPGPVVVPLTMAFTDSASACVAVTRERALQILKNPENYYVNVHNEPYPGGAVRGQLANQNR